ncbi:MAG: hypothetical protein JSU73_03885, partial [candidate division WOR-3 bacterium]
MPLTPDQLDAIERLLSEGREDDARFLLRRFDAENDQPTLPVIPEPEPEVPVFEGGAILQDRVEQEIQRQVDEAIALRIDELETPQQVAAERMRQEAAIRPQVERSLRVVSRPGIGVTTAPRTTLPFFRPTRIAVTSTGERVYRDPETGELREPTPGEEIVESFAQQQIMSPAEAQRRIGRGEAPMGILERVEPGEGIVEAPLTAAARGLLTAFEVGLGEGVFRPLTYEISPETANRARDKRLEAQEALANNQMQDYFRLSGEAEEILLEDPLDPTDYAYKLGKMRDWIGLPSTFFHPTLKGVVIPMPFTASVATTRPEYEGLPGSEAQRASDIEIPSPLEDFQGFKEAATQRLARNLTAGRSLGDETRDLPALANYYEAVWGDPNIAYWQGLAGSLFLPVGPGLAAKGAVQAARAAAPVARAAERGVDLVRVNVAQPAIEGAIRTARYVPAALSTTPEGQEVLRIYNSVAQGAKNIARANTPLEWRVGMNMYMARAAELAEATGDFVTRADALIRPGAASDALVIRKVAEKVMRAADLPAPTIARAMEAIPSDVASWGEAAGKIRLTIGDEVGKEVADAIARGLKIHVPDDFVMVTDDLAVPRAQAAEIRKGAENYVKEQIARSDANKGMYLDRIAGRLEESDPQVAIRLRAEADRYFKGKGKEKVALNLLREAEQKLADRGIVTGFRQKPMNEIIADLPTELRQTIPVNKEFAALDANDKRRVVEGLKEYWISRNARGVARSRFDLTSMQIGLDKVNRDLTNLLDYRWLNRPFTRRLAA